MIRESTMQNFVPVLCNIHVNNEIAHNLQTQWSRVLLEKLIVTQLVRKFPAFYGPEGSLLCSQDSTTVPYPEADEGRPHIHTVFV